MPTMIKDMDQQEFEQMLNARDGDVIAQIMAKFKQAQEESTDDILKKIKFQMLGGEEGGESKTFEQAVGDATKSRFEEFENGLPETIRNVLEAERQKVRENMSSDIITRQSLEDNWDIVLGKDVEGKDTALSGSIVLPIADFYQDIDSASGVSADRRANLNAIFAMLATNPFSPYVTMANSTGIGEVKMGVISGAAFTSDQATGGKKPTPFGTANRNAGDVVNATVGGLAEVDITIRRYYCNFVISNAAMEQVAGVRSAITRSLTQAFSKAIGNAIMTALNGATLAGRIVNSGTAAKVPTKENFPEKLGAMLAAPFPESMIMGDVAWVVKPEFWIPLVAANVEGWGFDPTMMIPRVMGFPWHTSSLFPALGAGSQIGYFGNYREAVAGALGPNLRIEMNRTTYPGYTYFHAEGAIGVTAHDTSGTIARMTAAA